MSRLFIILKKNTEGMKGKETLELVKKGISGMADMDAEVMEADEKDYVSCVNKILREQRSGFLFITYAGDQFDGSYLKKLISCMKKSDAETAVCSGQKQFIWDKKPVMNTRLMPQNTKELLSFPDGLNGVLLKLSCMEGYQLKKELDYDREKDLMLRLLLHYKCKTADNLMYTCGEPDDSQYQCFTGIYDRDWYFGHIDRFLLPLLQEVKETYKQIPLFLQYYTLYGISCRLEANQNNRNRHVLTGNDIDSYRERICRVLQYIDNASIMNLHDYTAYSKNYQFNRMLLRLKYRTEYLHTEYIPERTALGVLLEQDLIYLSNKMRVNILFIDYADGKLEIDASLPDVFLPDRVSYYFRMNDRQYEIVMNEGYSLVKYFGVSAYKRYTFHASVPVTEEKIQHLVFVMKYQNKEYVINPEYQSHTSRLSLYPVHSYWCFGNFIAVNDINGILIEPYSRKRVRKLEHGIWNELLSAKDMHHLKFFLLRFAWYMTRPFYKNKKIWMFYDKIYKGGDSAEYLYKYAMKQKDGIKKYYLVDKRAADYKRLKKEGYSPLKRGSMKHRLVFLNADMMLVTNSTVFAFNDYYLENSRYIRGIPDFHVVCLQHGLSVQKIALAQQRLRDNTRLYFCASKYEIENLSRPVYNYIGYDALKLTGVPRYDGLIDRDQKQILISPTWRMQSAMLVSRNEGVERDYNPNFKETDYYKVYNSLINDKRLIDAAKQYGYRIVYVLHPIVSPQAKDFDRNDYVDIIPATGDMSYERLFCQSSLMVTDYSGVQFDFAYMRKPLVYHHHRDLEAHYEEGTFHYDTMAFGEICHDNDELIALLCEYMKNGCKMKDLYRKRADDFFAFDDRNNCQRIYDILMEYQHERIDNN